MSRTVLTDSFLDQAAMAAIAQDPESPVRQTAPAPFVPYRGARQWEEEHPARPVIWALVGTMVPAFWAGTIYWLTQAVY
ncbi:hypothetical protein J4E08_15525 [Sagittula sp. NFXS13]|uniref:hypothetical protein n=1 Tax=Sagittula sp. NFXS13 TaxID=2819095 RepID=UPI0032E018FA